VKLTDDDRRVLSEVFASDAAVRAKRLEELLGQLEEAGGAGREQARFALAHEAHNLRGAAATVGLPEIERLAIGLEAGLEKFDEPGVERSTALEAAGPLLVALRAMAPAAEGLSTAESSPGASVFVLHIEDNASNLKLVERILARRPAIRLLEARDGESGLARRFLPVLVLLDLRMQGMSGEEVLRRLREDPATRKIPTVVISAEARPAESDRLLAAGADGYLVKPIDVETLLAIVDARLPSTES
jgi:CheY-like chemotaxis protein/HPt (histidine-containing phosphotransfer) domain-containing protein